MNDMPGVSGSFHTGVVLARALTRETQKKQKLIDAAKCYLDLGKQLDSEGLNYERDKLAIGELFKQHHKAKEKLIAAIKEAEEPE